VNSVPLTLTLKVLLPATWTLAGVPSNLQKPSTIVIPAIYAVVKSVAMQSPHLVPSLQQT
jgi:hypothetical protein